jgi:hypothetical protein
LEKKIEGDDLMQEIWKDIKGYEKYYQISNLGNVKRKKRIRYDKVRKIESSLKEMILKAGDNGNGYLMIKLYPDYKPHYIHRLVATAFIPNPDNLNCVNHKDCNPKNNVAENLEWCTQQYNIKYSFQIGNHKSPKSMLGKIGSKNHLSKPIKQIDITTNKIVRIWSNAFEVARELNYCRTSISKCCLNKQKTSYGYKWQFL